jgi:hypothetical protein
MFDDYFKMYIYSPYLDLQSTPKYGGEKLG